MPDKDYGKLADELLPKRKVTCEEYTLLHNEIAPIIAKLLKEIDEKEISVEEIERAVYEAYPYKYEYQVVITPTEFGLWCKQIAQAIKDKLKGDKITKEDVQPLIDKIKNS